MTLDLTTLSDGELATLSLAGRDAAFTEIVRRHRTSLYRLVLANVGDSEETLDLVQETFVSAYRALSRYDTGRSLRAWLSAIALNKCRDWGRRRAVRRLFSFAWPLEDVVDQVLEERPGQDVEAEGREELDRLRRAISQLPASLREPLVLHTIDGLSQAETASILGISEKAVETRLRRARMKLAPERER